MSFKQFYIESTDVFVSETEAGFQVIDHESFATISDAFDTMDEADQYATESGWNVVSEDVEWKELNSLTIEELDELEFTDYGTSICIAEDDEASLEYEDEISEGLKRVRVVRNGKRVLKIKTDKPGYRISRVGGRVKEVRMKSQEIRKRKRGQKIGSRKRKAKSAISQRKRLRSFKKRI